MPSVARFTERVWPAHKHRFARAASLGAWTTLVKLAAAVKVAATAQFFGAGDAADAFLIAFLLPSYCADVVAGALTPALVPVLIRARSNEGMDSAVRIAAQAQGALLGAMLGVTLVLAVGGRWVLPLVASGFSAEKLDLTARLLLAIIVWVPLSAFIVTWRAALWAHERFAISAAAPLAGPVATVAMLFGLSDAWGVWVLPVALVAGLAIETGLLGVGARMLGYSLAPRWPMRGDARLRELWRGYLPLMGSVLITLSGALIDQAVAGSLGSGSVSALAYGTRVYTVVIAVSTSALATALLPEFSRLASTEEWAKLRGSVRFHSVLVGLVMIPGSALLVWLSEPVVRAIFERGAFDAGATEVVSAVQRFALVQAPFFVAMQILSRLATALSANALIMRAAAAALIVNAVGDVVLSRAMGVAGIPLAAACGQAVGVALLGMLLFSREPRAFRAS